MLQLFISFLILNTSKSSLIFWNDYTLSNINEDSLLKTPELIKKYSYPAEIHKINTEDGYILEMHRMPRDQGKPVFLQHGLGDSSATFIFMGPKVSLGYYLWNKGYDVWMGNFRGNRYSRNHKNLDHDKNKTFWNFSWHEMGIYDLPAMIDYILQITKYEKLSYIGHSQGTTAFFVMCIKKPEYNTKVQIMQAIAPVAYLTHIKTPTYPFFEKLLKYVPENVLQQRASHHGNYRKLCTTNLFFENLCIKVYENIVGKNYNELNRTMLPVIVGHFPAGLAIKQLKHYIQVIQSKQFIEYDYGKIDNLKRYGNINPPKYNLSNVKVPVVFHYSLNDYFTHIIDVNQTYSELGNGQGKFLSPNSQWNHMDFLWSPKASSIFYTRLTKILDNFENKNNFTNN